MIAGRLVVGVAGPRLHEREAAWLRRYRPAGVILFHRNCPDAAALADLMAELRAALPEGAEICVDHEGGAVSFLQAASGRPPAARTLGDVDDPDLTHRVHAETARRLATLGIDRVLAPCCDVLTEAHNPVIGARAFGDGGDLVARHAVAAATGLAAGGLRGCVKHWPGHGGSRHDTHEREAAAVAPSADDDAPFTAALRAGLDAVMVGHLPSGAGKPPVSVDAEAVAALRRSLPDGTLIYSDDISMGALRESLAGQGVASPDGRDAGIVDPADLGLDWLQAVATAGCDRLLLRGIPWRALPLEDGEGPRLPADPPAPRLDEAGPEAAVYAEARQRAAAGAAWRPEGPVLWLDLTAGDRLGEAGAYAPALGLLLPELHRLTLPEGRLPGVSDVAAVLVTSHRPLSMEAAALITSLAAPSGMALGAGHPSLAGDLRRLLPDAWTVTDGPRDCFLGDLRPFLTAR